MNPAPISPEAEKSVLGAALIDPEAIGILSESVKPTHFYHQGNRLIYQAMLELHDEGHITDSVAVTERLRQKGQLHEAGDMAYLVGLMYENPGAYLVEQHVEYVLEAARLRALQQYGRMIDARIAEGLSSGEIVQIAENELADIATDMDGQPLADEYLAEAEAILDDDVRGFVQTGFYNLDRMLGGLKGLTIIAARPSSGKSSVARDIVRNIMRRKQKVALLSPDQSGVDVYRLEASVQSGVELTVFKGRTYSLEEAERWKRAMREFRQRSEEYLMLDDRPLTLPQVRSRYWNAVRWGAKVVIIDYLQLVDVPGLRADQEYASVTAVSKALKRLARETGVPVLALAQLNRSSEGRSNPRPVMSDIRASGQIEQDADAIIFIHRPNKFESAEVEDVEFIVAKQKDGPIGTVHLQLKRAFATFLNA